MAKSAERTQFLHDVMITALEGGINSWCYAETIVRHESDRLWYASYRIVCACDDDTECLASTKENPIPNCRGHVVTPEVIATGLRKATVKRGASCEYSRMESDENSVQIGWHYSQRKHVILANRENDGGEVDAYDASNIVQIALFGNVVVG